MASIQNHEYVKICSELATCLSISIASARRKVEIAARQQGVKDLLTKKLIAEKILKEALLEMKELDEKSSSRLDKLLVALAEEENFMVED